MGKIIIDERRAVRIGEVCAVKLKDIHAACISVDEVYKNFHFFGTGVKASEGEEVTLLKYLGNGLFMDLVSEQLITGLLINSDDFGGDIYDSMSDESKNEYESMARHWDSLDDTTTKEAYEYNYSVFLNSPLCIDIYDDILLSVDPDITKKFALQPIEEIRNKILTAKTAGQQYLQQQHEQYKELFDEYFELYANDKEGRYI